jgi:hypothetical protein
MNTKGKMDVLKMLRLLGFSSIGFFCEICRLRIAAVFPTVWRNPPEFENSGQASEWLVV